MSDIEYISVDEIKPAEYNPRKIDESDFNALCESLKVLGVIVPVIVNRANHIIIAGHQRQKAAKAIGIKEIPFFYADNVSQSDEILFNQIHNGTDFDLGCISKVSPQRETGWIQILPSDNFSKCEKVYVVAEVCKLIQRYGNVLSCVVTKDGDVFKSAAYASACRLLNIPCNAYCIEPEREEFAREAFNANYGVFSYDHLEKHTWVQGLAQLYRRKEKGNKGKTRKSRLYEHMVLPEITKDMRILDFGAGKEGYATDLKKQGFNVDCVEFYHNNGKAIDIKRTRREVEALFKALRTYGLYDVIVCDSVLNSVDSVEAEQAVVATCNALLKNNGVLYISGRPKRSVKSKLTAKHAAEASTRLCLEFLDEHGFSGRFRNGNFYYQKYHDDEDVKKLMQTHAFKIVDKKGDSSAWRVKCIKRSESPCSEEGVRFEFSLPYPGGRYDFDDDAIDAINAARELQANLQTASSCKSRNLSSETEEV